MWHNKFLFDIYQSVKKLNKDKIDKNTKKINNICKVYNHRGGSQQSEEDFKDIMTNLGIIEKGFLEYFTSLQKYIDIYLKNANEFEKLLNNRLSIESIEKLKKSMQELNIILADIK
jgi:hypothetical protein